MMKTKNDMRSAVIVDELIEVFTQNNLMTSPTAGLTSIKKVNGRKVESFTFGVSRYCDGVVDVYHKGYIRVKWQFGRQPHTASFHLMGDVVVWAETGGWMER